MSVPTLHPPVFRFRYRNPADASLNLWIEPLGDRVAIPAQTTVEVHCTEQLGHPSEFELSEDGVTVHGWVQSVFRVARDGELELVWSLLDH